MTGKVPRGSITAIVIGFACAVGGALLARAAWHGHPPVVAVVSGGLIAFGSCAFGQALGRLTATLDRS